ncbi:MAG: hypothetical protein QM770_23625 [Tepidisphaeraceae bacterium]
MSIAYAVERLYQTGWHPDDNEIDFLPDGTPLPSVNAVKRAFTRAGLELTLKQNQLFHCVHASWGEHTSVGQTDQEAAVWALAQFRENARYPKVVETKPAARVAVKV